MKRALSLAALFVAAYAAPARAEDVPPLPDPLPKAASSPYPIAPPRYLEAHVSTSLQLDWNRRKDLPADAGAARASFLGGLEIAVPWDNQRFRAGVFFGVQGGHWGDDRRGPLSLVPGLRFRASPFMEDFFDVYGVLRADLPISISTDAGLGLRAGAGVGVRVARAISVEGTYDVLVPISQTFRDTRFETVLPAAMTLTLSFDTCLFLSGCAPAELKPKRRNLSCRLYARAAEIGRAQRGVCDAIPKAMQAVPDPRSASRMDDGAGAFLAALAAETKSAEIAALAKLHAALADDLERWQSRSDAHAQVGLALRERWMYAPVPSELRRAFGCDGPAAECVELSDE